MIGASECMSYVYSYRAQHAWRTLMAAQREDKTAKERKDATEAEAQQVKKRRGEGANWAQIAKELGRSRHFCYCCVYPERKRIYLEKHYQKLERAV